MESELDVSMVVYEQEESTSTPENVADCGVSGDEDAEPVVPSPKKRKGEKRVISVPIDGGDESSRSKGEVYPPPDSWSWRKYGQKPIKGSPYPRAYYRCSSSKGCPAKKQIERSCVDPTMLDITYTHDHNHLLPTTTKHHHRVSATAVAKTSPTTTSTPTATKDIVPTKLEYAALAKEQDLESDNSGFSDLTVDLGWFSDVGSTSMIESSTLFGPEWDDADVALMLPIGEEDQSLFGDLGELPECSLVFRHRYSAETPCYGGT